MFRLFCTKALASALALLSRLAELAAIDSVWCTLRVLNQTALATFLLSSLIACLTNFAMPARCMYQHPNAVAALVIIAVFLFVAKAVCGLTGRQVCLGACGVTSMCCVLSVGQNVVTR